MKSNQDLRGIVCKVLCFVALVLQHHRSNAQSIDSVQSKLVESVSGLSDKGFGLMRKSYALLQRRIEKQTAKALMRMQKNEAQLQNKLKGIDSVKSHALFAETKAKYEKMLKQLQTPSLTTPGIAQSVRSYVPRLDSMQTALKYLQLKGVSLPEGKLQQVEALSTQLKSLQSKFQSATQVQNYLRQREQLLKQQLSNLPVGKQLLSINKEAYYYQQRLAGYKAALKDKDKWKQTLLAAVTTQPAFKKFWQKHSMLASMFPMNMQEAVNTDSLLKGLQTRSQIGALINEKTGNGLAQNSFKATQASGSNYISQQVQQAKSELDILKQKLRKLGGGGSAMVIPDFTPNSQKTKTFLKRIEYGFNMQNSPTTNWLPATSNIAVMLGYKFTDKMVAGVGAGYLLGWGTPVKDIHFSNQGLNLRSFMDIKAKGSLWMTGGFEYSYMKAFANINSIRNLDVWQKSALIGLTKKIKTGSKTTNIQILYDFLANQQIPHASALKFRVGYSF